MGCGAAGQAQGLTPISVPGERVHPESFSIAPDGMAYVASLTGGVVRVSLRTGKGEQFLKAGAGGSASIFGVFADPVNKLLWVCSNDMSGRGVVIPGADKGTHLKSFDLATGAPKGSYALGADSFCNDTAVAKDGTLYVTETNKSHILRLKPGATALEDWHHDPAYAGEKGSGLDGIAMGGDGNLYVNNYQSNVMARVEVKPDGTAGKTTVLQTPRPLASPDGLRSMGGLRFAQAESKGNVTVVTVNGDKADVLTLGEGIFQPTTVDTFDGKLYYTAPQFEYVFNPQKRAETPPPAQLTPIAIPAAGGHAHH
jgi:streptogramin lyase